MDCTYLEFYSTEIMPRLKEIDLTLKSGREIDVNEAARLLDIMPDELESHMLRLGIHKITGQHFLSIMQAGSSKICSLFSRELERQSPICYTAQDIAYIYDLNLESVQEAFAKIKATHVSSYMLTTILATIDI